MKRAVAMALAAWLAFVAGCGSGGRAAGMTSCSACRTECPQKITCAKDGRCAGCDTCSR